MNEAALVKERYERRKTTEKKDLYSDFNPAALFVFQERQRKVLALLKRYGCEELKSKRILEIGCGEGRWLRDLIQWGATPDQLYGIDLLDYRITVAQDLNPNIHYATANAEQLDFPDKHFDIVLLATCLTSILDLEMRRRVTAEALRVLRDKGMVLWYDFRYDNPRNPDVKGINKREIIELFRSCTCHFTSVTLAPPIARLLAPISWLSCEMLAKMPFLKTHYLVVVTKDKLGHWPRS